MIIQSNKYAQNSRALSFKAIARLQSVRNLQQLWQETAKILGTVLEISQSLIIKPVNHYMAHWFRQQELPESGTKVTQESNTNLLLKAIVRLRSVRDLQQLWQETAKILGSTLKVSRCLILDQPLSEFPTVVAEYHQGTSFNSMLGQKVPRSADTNVQKALTSFRPVVIKNVAGDRPSPTESLLIIATHYDRQLNGLIYLYYDDRHSNWTEAELELVQQLAEQVGYYIAHLYMQQELQEAKTKIAQLTSPIENFLQNINDKLRNPLNGIIGSLNLILDDVLDDPEEQREFIQDAHYSSVKLLQIINDLLHFSNLRGNQISDVELGKPVKLSKIIMEVERLSQPRTEHQNLYLNIIKADNFDEIILSTNESRLLQVFLNVVGNAIKFTHAGGVTISYEVITDPLFVNNQEYPGSVEIRVSDTGIGVATEYLSRVFDPFFQVHDSRTSPYPGTGLGLSISKKLIELMGGEINFYSMGEGLGSSVIFTVPLDKAQ